MNVLYGEKASVFHILTDDFTPESVRSVADVLSSRLSSAELAAQVAHDFERLEAISRVLRSRYNDCSAFFRLPPECIAVIIQFIAEVEPPRWNARNHSEDGQESQLPNTLGFIRLGHVCHRLRDTLLNMRSLWAAYAFAMSPGAVGEMIARAGTVPLSMKLENWEHPPLQVLKSIRDHIHNARIISFPPKTLLARYCAWPFEMKTLHRETFPYLEELTLEFPLIHAQDETAYQRPPLNAPQLRRISMGNVFIPCILSSLESFELQYDQDTFDEIQLPSNPVFLDLLRGLSNVRVLTLENCLPIVLPRCDEDTPLFAFPHLEELRLGGPMTTCQALWSYLQFPSDTRVRLTVDDDSMSRPGQLDFLETISPHFRQSGCPRITGLSVDDDQRSADQLLRLVFAYTKAGVSHDSWSGPLASDHEFLLDISLSGWMFEAVDETAGPFIPLLERMYELYNLQELKTIELAATIGSNPTRWKDALRRYKTVTTFAIDPFPPHQGLWEALCPQTLADGELHIFPNLEYIAIENTLGFNHFQIGYEDDDPAMPADWADFCPGLERRAAAGVGIKRLSFGNFRTDDLERAEELLSSLHAIVPEVVGTPIHFERRPQWVTLGGMGMG
ncbi:unnamed protein product [Peniophora sp. CBMAI 1063]|nr:unnamed protein product [Peniophora sp. CBMAI 1063]